VIHVRQKYGLSERQACRYLNQPRSIQRRRLVTPDDEAALTADIVRLASL
jgi:putative transposase